MTSTPAAANGLEACTEAQIGYAPEEGKIRFATTPQSCPDASKLGTLEVKTPLLEEAPRRRLPGQALSTTPSAP